MRSRGAWSTVVLLALPGVTPADDAPNLLVDPGFEEDSAWVAQGAPGSATFASSIARSGQRSGQCAAEEAASQGGFLHEFELNQTRALPLLIGGWSRAENVSGPRDNHYSVWCDVKYVEQLRPGRIDKAAIAPFEVGTHDWQEARTLLLPERPIKTVKLHALFRRHSGTVWFDDLFVRELEPFVPPRLAKPQGTPRTLPAEGRLGLDLLPDGTIDSLTIDGSELQAEALCGLFVGDYNQRRFWPATGSATVSEDSADLRAPQPEAGLELSATITGLGRAVEVSGWVRDTTGQDRAVDVCLTLPATGEGWHWSRDLTGAAALAGTPVTATDGFPLVCVTREDVGLAVGIPPDSPCVFAFGWAPETGLTARVKLGLSQDAGGNLRSRAPFRFVLLPVEPEWGYRDALRAYYACYPEPFERRAKAEGLWLFAFPPAELPNPDHYAYWEGGPNGATEAAEQGIGCYPYIIPVQRSILRLPKLPTNYDEAMAFLDTYAPTHEGFGGTTTREQILNAGIHDGRGRYDIRIRDDVGADVKPKNPINMVVFSVSPNPNLLADTDQATPAKTELARVRKLIADSPEIAGIYLDSMTGWSGRKLNFRRDHFPYETIPLTYDDLTGRVAIHGRFDGVQFLEALGDLLHPGGRSVFQNLNHSTTNVWHWFCGDVCGCEGGFRGLSEANYCFFRAAAYHKPVLLLDYPSILGRPIELSTRAGMERYFRHATAFGFYPAVGRYCDDVYEEHRDLYDTYIPIIKRLSAAGWEPVTAARASAPQVHLERFGPSEGKAYLTVFNPTDQTARAEITWRPEELGWPAVGEVRSLVTGQVREGTGTLKVDLPPIGLEVVVAERP